MSDNAWTPGPELKAAAELERMKALVPEMAEAMKECAVLIAQNHGRKLTSEEQGALDNVRAILSKIKGEGE